MLIIIMIIIIIVIIILIASLIKHYYYVMTIRYAWILKIHQRGVQWKQGVVVYIISWAVVLYNTTPIHCTALRLHPPCNEYPATATTH